MKKSDKRCPVEYSAEILGGKWKFRIIYALMRMGVVRFKALERELGGITPKMLTTQLKCLEADGLVSRKAYATVPPTVEYQLTSVGESIKPLMAELTKWGLYHQQLKK